MEPVQPAPAARTDSAPPVPPPPPPEDEIEEGAETPPMATSVLEAREQVPVEMKAAATMMEGEGREEREGEREEEDGGGVYFSFVSVYIAVEIFKIQ